MPRARRRLLSVAALLLSLPLSAAPATAAGLDLVPVTPASQPAASPSQPATRTPLDHPVAITEGPTPGTLTIDREPVKGRIVAGVPTDIKTVPWQVWLFSSNAVGSSMCGGSIVAPTTVITAAHCVQGLTMNNAPDNNGLGVIAGISNFETQTPGDILQGRKATSWVVHPRYLHNRLDLSPQGDVAVVTLASALDLSGTNAKAIPLPPANTPASIDGEPVPVGPAAKISGYGLQANGVEASGQLFSLDTQIVDPDACGDSPNAVGVCSQAAAGAICSGDSGGGLVSGGVLVGVVSVGGAQCRSGDWANYASLLAPENRLFVASPAVAPPVAPRVTAQPRGSSSNDSVGGVLTCSGAAFDSGASVKYVITNDLGARLAATVGSGITYTHTLADVGRKLRCRAYGSNAGGVATSALLEAPLPIAAPAPVPTATPKPAPKSTPKPGAVTGLGNIQIFGTVTRTVRRGSTLRIRAGLRGLPANVAQVRMQIAIGRGKRGSLRTIHIMGGRPSGATTLTRTFKHRMRGQLAPDRYRLRVTYVVTYDDGTVQTDRASSSFLVRR